MIWKFFSAIMLELLKELKNFSFVCHNQRSCLLKWPPRLLMSVVVDRSSDDVIGPRRSWRS